MELQRNNNKSTSAAILFTGIQAGSLLFISFVSCKSLKSLPPKDSQQFFKVWWKHGRTFLVPVTLAASFANIFAFRAVGELSWLIAAGCSAMTILFTGAFMKRDIERIALESDPKEIESSVHSFTMKHHVRSVLAISAFTIGILKSGGFAKQK